LEKAGSLFKNKGIEEKGAEKREQAGFGGSNTDNYWTAILHACTMITLLLCRV